MSGGDTLRRYEDEQLPVILKDPVRVARINRLLGMDRDGKRLTTVAADAVRFLDLSIESRSKRERERDEVEKAALQSRDAAEKEKAGRVTQRLWLLLLAVVVILLLPLTIWVKTLAEAEKQLANKERALNRSYALAVETLVGFQPQFRDLAGPQGLLRYSLIGSHFLDDGRQLTTSPLAIDQPLLRNAAQGLTHHGAIQRGTQHGEPAHHPAGCCVGGSGKSELPRANRPSTVQSLPIRVVWN